MDKIKLYNGDCLEVMDKLIEQGVKVDAIITDPPYGTTACKWDSAIPFNSYIIVKKNKKEVIMYEDEWVLKELKQTNKNIEQCIKEFKENSQDGMWKRLNKLIKPNGAIVLFGSEPFSSALRMSNIKNYKYDWVWNKRTSANVGIAKYQPLKTHEMVHIFSSKGKAEYFPQMRTGKMRMKGGKVNGGIASGGMKPKYYKSDQYYPISVLDIKTERGYHPTQKPVILMEYLIKTYTNENEIVLDFTMGSGTTGIACVKNNRDFIGIEKDKGYFKIAQKRIGEIEQ